VSSSGVLFERLWSSVLHSIHPRSDNCCLTLYVAAVVSLFLPTNVALFSASPPSPDFIDKLSSPCSQHRRRRQTVPTSCRSISLSFAGVATGGVRFHSPSYPVQLRKRSSFLRTSSNQLYKHNSSSRLPNYSKYWELGYSVRLTRQKPDSIYPSIQKCQAPALDPLLIAVGDGMANVFAESSTFD
jgi:hypothetical protein